MADDKHRRRQETVHFCANAAQPKCECATPNDYRAPCDAEAKKWGGDSHKYWQKHTKKDDKKRITELTKKKRSHEAHHALPVACVANQVLKWDDKFDADVAKATKWCINNKDNMIALPLWGHTIMHYCNNFEEMSQEIKDELEQAQKAALAGAKKLPGLSVAAKKSLAATATRDTAPGFKNLPQHNYGHTGKSVNTSYNKEIYKLLKKAGLKIKNAAAVHKTATLDSVAGYLETHSKRMVEELKSRGTRSYGGTHESWIEAMKKKRDWCESFGMAKKPKYMPFPLGPTSKGLADKIAKMAQTMWMPE